MQLGQTDYTTVQMAGRELKWQQDKWGMLAEFEGLSRGWLTDRASTLDPEAIQTKVDEMSKANYKMIKARKDDPVCARLKSQIDGFKECIPMLTLVADEALKDRHWAEIYALMGQEYVAGETVPSVQGLLDGGLPRHFDALEAIVGNAVKENNLLKNLDKMEREWKAQEFRVVPYKSDYIVGGVDDIQTILDDQIVKIQAMNGQPYIKPFEERSKLWEATLTRLQEILDAWLKVQSTWMYLEPIFSSDDIVKQMPEEGAKFSQVDANWKTLMKNTKDAPSVIPIAQRPEVLEVLLKIDGLLEEIQARGGVTWGRGWVACAVAVAWVWRGGGVRGGLGGGSRGEL